MNNYYSKQLSANKLKRCYNIASPRIKQYLEAEIKFVLEQIKPSDKVLELGCGYGRVLKRIAEKAAKVIGIDTSSESIQLAEKYLQDYTNIELFQMNAKSMDFKEQSFDVVIGIQNSISAFKVKPEELTKESLRVTKQNGKVIFSSYSDKIWQERLDWFAEQSEEGLLGEINFMKTGKGVIICKDGFKATTFTKDNFEKLLRKMKLKGIIIEIDNSSIFCVISNK
ncbi:MAG: class I SAM-dependent methyltransferase [Candidatus Heimdallarchaeota archaeon]